MKVLWDRGDSTVAEVQQEMDGDRTLAHNTIATILSRLAKDNVVDVRRDGRTNVYRPKVEEQAIKQTMVSGLLSRLFDGNASALVHHLVREGELDASELESLAKLVSRKADKR